MLKEMSLKHNTGNMHKGSWLAFIILFFNHINPIDNIIYPVSSNMLSSILTCLTVDLLLIHCHISFLK